MDIESAKEDLQEITEKLDTIIRLLAISAAGQKTLREKVSILYSSGFRPKEIADLLSKTPNHIRVVLHELKKRKKQNVEELNNV